MKTLQILFSRVAKHNASTGTLHTAGIGSWSGILQLSARRLVHSTLRKDHTTLLSNDKLASFNVLSLKALKNECRNRGLKISGRKGELVDRILAFENSKSLPGTSSIASSVRQLHFSRAVGQKGDSRPVDDVKLPDVAATEDALQSLDKEYIVHITPLSESADQKPVTMLEKELLATENSPLDKTPQVSTTDHDKVIFQADAPEDSLDIVNEEYETAKNNDADATNKSDPSKESDSLESRDKTFLLSVAGLVAGWWSLKLWSKKGDREH
ncbi:Aim34p LALA0_S08e01508g [Lachancea lanzarotensis]|uniref:LALA0S08e01508g1_1 n=1 Tax=Lachancea lanzarotensis TaxID=1245769 RepID=A0A0C7NA55_9SACH|nr:uncharacterized protein LALA0_S08e01508g [Lachancea lanzarotensis]CEP63397.1 LALA0S08e01508g1_1 [Lachancea lanzarotensis]